MVKVKLVKFTNDEELGFVTEEEKCMLGRVFEAFLIDNKGFNELPQFALNVDNHYVWFVPTEWCEVLYDTNEPPMAVEDNSKTSTTPAGRILLVEDGSVDIDKLEDDLGITYIVYRQGSNKPEWL